MFFRITWRVKQLRAWCICRPADHLRALMPPFPMVMYLCTRSSTGTGRADDAGAGYMVSHRDGIFRERDHCISCERNGSCICRMECMKCINTVLMEQSCTAHDICGNDNVFSGILPKTQSSPHPLVICKSLATSYPVTSLPVRS